MLWAFQDDFEGLGALGGAGAEDAVVGGVDDAIDGVEAIDNGAGVAGQDVAGGLEGWGEHLLGDEAVAGEAVEAVAGVVGVQGDDAVELVAVDFLFQEGDFGIGGVAPELAIEVAAGGGLAGAGEVAGGVAEGVEVQLEFAAEFGEAVEFANKVHETEDAGGFVAVDAGEDAQFEAVFDDLGALEGEAGEPEASGPLVPEADGGGFEAGGGGDLQHEGHEEVFDGGAQAEVDLAGDLIEGFDPEVVEGV